MITIAMCDDNISYLKNTLFKSVMAATYKANMQADIRLFSDGIKLLDEYENGNRFDIVILDIDMSSINGKELASCLRRMDFSFFLVFVTDLENELANAIRYRINAFILKSGDSDKMDSEFERVFSEYLLINPQYEVFEILKEGILSAYKVELNNILGFYLSEKIIHLKTVDKDYILKERKFNEILERFLCKNFVECHRNYIVNLNRVSEVTESVVVLENGDMLPVSRRNHSKLLKEFTKCVMKEKED